MVRPKSIIWFERLFLGSWLVSMIGLAVNWPQVTQAIENNPASRQLGADTVMNMMIGFMAIGALITFVLWYFVARQASVVAKWFVVAFFVLSLLGVPATFRQLTSGQMLPGLLQLVVFVLHAAAVAMLFQHDARLWLGEIGDDADDDIPPRPLS